MSSSRGKKPVIVVALRPGSDGDPTHRPTGGGYVLVDPPTLYLEKIVSGHVIPDKPSLLTQTLHFSLTVTYTDLADVTGLGNCMDEGAR